jgi:3-deoxy-D-manno-octulosonate 8-phosphate phosphatase (KDO 8-P phosphatase)
VTELLILDVDGCLTDGRITYYEDGNESKSFDVKDGLAISTWVRMGKEVAIITGRKSGIVERRAKELGIAHLHQGVRNKAETVKSLSERTGIALDDMAAIGDDLNDLQMLQTVGVSYVPNNASRFVKAVADTVLSRDGGNGAVREMIEDIIVKDDQEEAFLALWR